MEDEWFDKNEVRLTIKSRDPIPGCDNYTHLNKSTMSRLHALFSWLVLFLLIPSLSLAHTIQVSAGKKECFFEDLHINDQVRVHFDPPVLSVLMPICPEDDCNLSSR